MSVQAAPPGPSQGSRGKAVESASWRHQESALDATTSLRMPSGGRLYLAQRHAMAGAGASCIGGASRQLPWPATGWMGVCGGFWWWQRRTGLPLSLSLSPLDPRQRMNPKCIPWVELLRVYLHDITCSITCCLDPVKTCALDTATWLCQAYSLLLLLCGRSPEETLVDRPTHELC